MLRSHGDPVNTEVTGASEYDIEENGPIAQKWLTSFTLLRGASTA